MKETDSFYETLKQQLEQVPTETPQQEDWNQFQQFRQQKRRKAAFLNFGLFLPALFLLVQLLKPVNHNAVSSNTFLAGVSLVSVQAKLLTSENSAKAKLLVKPKVNSRFEPKMKKAQPTRKSVKVVTNLTPLAMKVKQETTQLQNQILAEPILAVNSIVAEPSVLLGRQINRFDPIPNLRPLGSVNFSVLPVQGLKENMSFAKVNDPAFHWVSMQYMWVRDENSRKVYKEGYAFQLAKQVANNWYLNTGLQYYQFTNGLARTFIHPFQTTEVAKINTNLWFNPASNKIEMRSDTVYHQQNHEETVNHTRKLKVQVWEIPLAVGYERNLGKLRYGAQLGLIGRITQTTQLDNLAYTITQQNETAKQKSTSYSFGNTLGITLAYPLHRKLYVQASPACFIQYDAGSLKLLNTRYSIGLRYYLH